MKVVEFIIKLVITVKVLSLVCFCGLAFGAIWHEKEGDELKESDCAIVFGAGMEDTEVMDNRLLTAINLYNDGYFDKLILSGGKEDEEDEETQAEYMRRIALKEDFPLKDMYLDKNSDSTYENIKNSKEIAKRSNCGRVLAVSSNYHLARLKYSAKQEKFKIYTYPADNSSIKESQLDTAREVVALVYYYFKY